MRILVVEDEMRIANAVKKGLKQEHYAVDLAYTGTQGLDLATSETYDLILLDVMLPELDGVALCKSLREQQNHTPILMLTARDQIQDKIRGLDAGADDYLTKPFSFEELLARIRALLRRPTQMMHDVLTVDDLTLNANDFSVKRADKTIKLSNKEYSLLDFLMRHPHQIMSKDMIINHVWDYDAEILPNTVEVTIRNLRKKIDEPFSDQPSMIQTIRGYGYRLGAA